MTWINDPKTISGPLAAGFKPDPILSISEWADKYRQLPESSAEPGLWRTSRTPYAKKIMDVASPHHPCRKFVVKKGSQLGITEVLINISFFYVDYVPTNQMIVYPTKETAERTSKTRIAPSARAMPSLREKIAGRKSKESGDTILMKEFPGGSMFFSGANSPATLASVPIRILLLDEVDRFPADCGGEGNPVDLAEVRTTTYSNSKKIGLVSTPVHEGASIIDAEWELSNKQYYYVPCPHCQAKQPLIFDNIQYEVVNQKVIGDVTYLCDSCGENIHERFKPLMLRHGEWIATAESEVEGFFINGLYSPLGWLSWKQIAQEEVNSRRDEKKRKVFVNTRMGEVYSQGGEAPDAEILYLKRETYPETICPKGVLFLTMGVDIQGDRIEGEVVGWGANFENWSIAYKTFRGDVKEPAVWDELENYIRKTLFEVEDSTMKLPLQIVGIDTGYRSQVVYRFVRRFEGRQVYAFKGKDTYDYTLSRPTKIDVILDERTKKKKKRALDLYTVGVSGIKEDLYMHLKQSKPEDGDPFPPGYCHFPEYGKDYFESLASEKCVIETVGYKSKKKWIKIVERNEALDVRVYNRAAAALYGYDSFTPSDFDRMYRKIYLDQVQEIQTVKDSKRKVKITRRKGNFL